MHRDDDELLSKKIFWGEEKFRKVKMRNESEGIFSTKSSTTLKSKSKQQKNSIKISL